MLKRLGRILIVVLVATLMLTNLASADSPKDKLVGSGQFGSGPIIYHFTASAHSGASGEDPYGQVIIKWPYVAEKSEGKVTCLSVEGNTATAVARLNEPIVSGATFSDFYLWVTDNGAPGNSPDDEMSAMIATGYSEVPPVTNCWANRGWTPVEKGNYVINDATP